MKKILFLMLLLSLGNFIFAQEVYKSKVTASYYAEDFHGKRTSNGETFNMNSLTCAHKSLPFNTVLKVTNLANGKTVQVRVNDRGPFVLNREIDLSKAAAVQLGMIGTGTTQVRLEIVKKGPNTKLSKQTAASASKIMTKRFGADWNKTASGSTGSKTAVSSTTKKIAPKPAGTRWDIQVGAFSSKENATNRARALTKAGFSNIVFQKKDEIIRVAIKDVAAEDLPEIEKKLQEKGFTEYTLRQRNK
ncbi:MAG: septal ring lytic transglycosylase RlpA family protein [Treponema sp.]|nr:septal ring lytic transglycosylase RlpA family protein [Treponema sp.]